MLPLLFGLPPVDFTENSPNSAEILQLAPSTTDDGEVISTHADALREHRNAPPALRNWPRSLPQRSKTTSIVYGYLPYWVSDTSKIKWDLLSHVAHFSTEVNSDGTLGNKHGWPDNPLVTTAHAAGVKVEVAFTLFSGTSLATLLNSPANRAKAIDNMVAEMETGNADGISLDFEGVPASARDGLTAFCTELRAKLKAKGHPDAGISIAAPAVDWSNAFNIPALLEQIDVYFIMAYDFFYSSSTKAGPSGIFRTSAKWKSASSYSTLRSVATTSKLATENLRKKIVVGVPYYGYSYPTTGSDWPAAATATGVSMTYSSARAKLASGTPKFTDDTICQPALIWQEGGTWHQSWYEDEKSLACKYELVEQHEVGGTGMWALGSDNGYSELWDLLDKHFTAPAKLGEGSRDAPIAITQYPFEDSKDTSKAGFRYFDYYSCKNDVAEYGREFSYQIDVCQKGTLHLEVSATGGADPDLHLLSALREDKCIERNDAKIDRDIEPGRYFVVVDTFVSAAVELEGPYTFKANFVPTSGNACPSGTTCESGSCVCPSAETLCTNTCVKTATDNKNCGACGKACAASESCQNGQCKGGNLPDSGPDSSPPDSGPDSAAPDVNTDASLADTLGTDTSTNDSTNVSDASDAAIACVNCNSESESGCSCSSAGLVQKGGHQSWFAVLVAGLLLRRKRNRAC